MSALGQSQKWQAVRGESALPRITDMQGLLQHVRFVPIGDIGCMVYYEGEAANASTLVIPSYLSVLFF